MTKNELQEKVTKALENISKVENTIKKHEARMEKLNKKLERYKIKNREEWHQADDEYRQSDNGFNNYWLICDIENCAESIVNSHKKLIEKQEIAQKWQSKLEQVKSDEKTIPQCLIQFRDAMVESWDEYDKVKRAHYQKLHKEFLEWYNNGRHSVIEYKAKLKELNFDERIARSYIHLTDEEIHKNNLREGNKLIKNLMVRVYKKCGEITSWAGLGVVMGNEYEGATINGFVEGTLGKAKVESILAGGYNIQKLHIRTLVK